MKNLDLLSKRKSADERVNLDITDASAVSTLKISQTSRNLDLSYLKPAFRAG